MKKYFPFVFVLLILGCVAGGRGVTSYSPEGVKILSFEPAISEILSGKAVDLRVQVQNVGEADALNTRVEIFRPSNLVITPLTSQIGKLNKPDVVSNLPGQTGEAILRATAPTIAGKNQRVVSDVGARVIYGYRTVVTAEVPVLTEGSYQEHVQENTIPAKIVDSSIGPVKVDLLTPNFVYEGEIPITLELSKAVPGYVKSDGLVNPDGTLVMVNEINSCSKNDLGADGGLNRIDYLRIKYDSAVVEPVCNGNACKECPFGPAGTGTLELGCVELYSNQKRQLSCTFELVADLSAGSEIYPDFVITADYVYVAETSTSLTIKGS
ncbi:MAG: hypothetical protein ABH829_03850 [archaeon]